MNLKYFRSDAPGPLHTPHSAALVRVPLKVILPCFAVLSLVVGTVALTVMYKSAEWSLQRSQQQLLDSIGQHSITSVVHFLDEFQTFLAEVGWSIKFNRFKFHPWVLKGLSHADKNRTDVYSCRQLHLMGQFASLAKYYMGKESATIVLNVGLGVARGDYFGMGVDGNYIKYQYSGPETNFTRREMAHDKLVMSNQSEGMIPNFPNDWGELQGAFANGRLATRPNFYATDRAWYRAAASARRATWRGAITRIDGSLSLTAAIPVYAQNHDSEILQTMYPGLNVSANRTLPHENCSRCSSGLCSLYVDSTNGSSENCLPNDVYNNAVTTLRQCVASSTCAVGKECRLLSCGKDCINTMCMTAPTTTRSALRSYNELPNSELVGVAYIDTNVEYVDEALHKLALKSGEGVLIYLFDKSNGKLIASSLQATPGLDQQASTVDNATTSLEERILTTATLVRSNTVKTGEFSSVTVRGKSFAFVAYEILHFGQVFGLVTVVPQELFFGYFNSQSKKALAIIVPIVGLIVAMCIVITFYLSGQIKLIVQNVQRISELEIQETPYQSRLTEFSKISDAFSNLAQKLILYKSYIPEAVYVQPHDDAGAESTTKSSQKGKDAKDVRSDNSSHGDHSSSDTSGNSSQSLRITRGSLVCIAFTSSMKDGDFSGIVVGVAEAVKKHRGAILQVYADRIIVAFAPSGMSECAASACRLAEYLRSSYTCMRIGIATSAIEYGPVGGRVFRTMSCAGDATTTCIKLALLAVDINLPVLTCDLTNRLVEAESVLCPVAMSRSKKPIFALIKTLEKGNGEEWLYTVGRVNNATEPLMKSFHYGLKGQFFDALEILHSLADNDVLSTSPEVKYYTSAIVANFILEVDLSDTVHTAPRSINL